MRKFLIVSMLALGFGMATSGHAAVPSGAGDRTAPPGAVQLAQGDPHAGVRTGPRGPAVAPRGPVGVQPRGNIGAPQRGFVPRGNVGVPQRGFGGQSGYVGRPGFVGRPAYVGRPGFVGRPAFVRGYRPFYRRPWFGTVLGGVALGTFLTVATVGIAPAYAPAPGLCWYWADPSMTQGYWDYCEAPY